MALYRQDGCSIWYVDFRAFGRRVRRTTGTTDYKEARAIEAALRVSVRAQDGRRAMARMAEDIFPERVQGVPLSRLEAYYDDAAKATGYTCGETTARMRRSAMLRLTAWAKRAGLKTVDEVTVEAATTFLEALTATAKTRRNIAGELSSVWRVLAKRGMADINPWRAAKPAPEPGRAKHGRAFTQEEARRILEACVFAPNGEEWRDMVTVALHTGLRLTDVLNLEGRMADLEARELRLMPAKTRRRGIVVRLPLHPDVEEVFRRRGFGRLFPEAAKECRSHRRQPFADILRRAKIEAKPGEKLTFHCLRHTFATWLAEAGVPEDVRMQLCGHTVASTARLYNHDTSQARRAILSLQ